MGQATFSSILGYSVTDENKQISVINVHNLCIILLYLRKLNKNKKNARVADMVADVHG